MPSHIDFVVTARPSWSRVRSLVENYAFLQGNQFARVIFIDTANSRNYGDVSKQNSGEIKKISFLTHYESDSFESRALSVSSGIEALARFWSINRPDAALVIADRTETVGVSSAAALMQIPLIHLQGGEVSGSIDNKVRDANSVLADFHLTTNNETANRLVGMGIQTESIRIIGCPSLDIVRQVLSKDMEIKDSSSLGGTGQDVDFRKPFGLVMFHPDTLNILDTEANMMSIIETINSSREFQWIWFWPNSDYGSSYISKQMRVFRESGIGKKVKFLVNVLPEVFVHVASKSSFILGNSSFGIREASFLGLPAINLGARQNNRQRAENVIDLGGLSSSEICIAIDKCLSIGRFGSSELYGDGFAGKRGAECLTQWNPVVRN